jgi:hypothetical protein
VVEHGVTSFADLGLNPNMEELDLALKASFDKVFGGLDLV